MSGTSANNEPQSTRSTLRAFVLFCLFYLFICVVVDKAVQHVGTQGYVLGNPVTDYEIDTNSIVPFAHLKALISDKLYEVTSLS